MTPSLVGYTFSPSNIVVTISGTDKNDIDFTAIASTTPTYTISGTVSGAVVSGVTITLTGENTGSTLTDSSGNYSFSSAVNGSYTLTPFKDRLHLNPSSVSVTVNGANLTVANMIATSTGGTGSVKLPKTGQTNCYDTSGNVISCSGTGQDGELQKGVAWPSLRFTDNGDQTVTDKLTGLMWAKDANLMKKHAIPAGIMMTQLVMAWLPGNTLSIMLRNLIRKTIWGIVTGACLIEKNSVVLLIIAKPTQLPG